MKKLTSKTVASFLKTYGNDFYVGTPCIFSNYILREILNGKFEELSKSILVEQYIHNSVSNVVMISKINFYNSDRITED